MLLFNNFKILHFETEKTKNVSCAGAVNGACNDSRLTDGETEMFLKFDLIVLTKFDSCCSRSFMFCRTDSLNKRRKNSCLEKFEDF